MLHQELYVLPCVRAGISTIKSRVPSNHPSLVHAAERHSYMSASVETQCRR